MIVLTPRLCALLAGALLLVASAGRRHPEAVALVEEALAQLQIRRIFAGLAGNVGDTPVFSLSEHTEFITALAWSPDGAWIVSAGQDRTMRFWERTDGGKTP